MYDPSTIELALEMGLDPGDFSTGPHEPFADDSGVGFQTYPPRKIDDFQDDIGDYRSSYTQPVYLKIMTREFFSISSGTSCSTSNDPIFHGTA